LKKNYIDLNLSDGHMGNFDRKIRRNFSDLYASMTKEEERVSRIEENEDQERLQIVKKKHDDRIRGHAARKQSYDREQGGFEGELATNLTTMIEAMSDMDEKMNVLGTTPSTEGTADPDTAEIRRMFNMGVRPAAKKAPPLCGGVPKRLSQVVMAAGSAPTTPNPLSINAGSNEAKAER
jgi:hypothetical protein